VAWSNVALTRLFSGSGRARTHAAHCASLGSAEPGGSVEKCAGAPAVLAAAAAAAVAAAAGDGVAVGVGCGVSVVAWGTTPTAAMSAGATTCITDAVPT
jgi:hypothetical protein